MDKWSELTIVTSDVAEEVEALKQIEPAKNDDL